jgi:hypothetical protein
MTSRALRASLLGLALFGVSGCAVQGPLYHWGPYETLVYQMVAEPGRADPGAQVERLSRDVAAAQANGERVAPGVHMHLGYMYWLAGNAVAARAEIETEKRIFPESTVFADRLLASMGAP